MVTVGHIALFVPDLREAETFYQHVFGMHLLMREAELDNHLWYTLPTDKGWDDADAAGIELGMLALRRDAFVLALFQGKPVPEDTVLEIGISMTAEAIAAARDRLPDTVELVKHERGDLMFRDPFGYLWHLWLAGKAFRSNGESSGRWLEV
jgi:catechol 2,3-dioxygenase-like lactoylglutathione lyase family enzyme